jgi:hypothetical protein
VASLTGLCFQCAGAAAASASHPVPAPPTFLSIHPQSVVGALLLAGAAAFVYVRRKRARQAEAESNAARQERRAQRRTYTQSGRAISAGSATMLAPAAEAVAPVHVERANL